MGPLGIVMWAVAFGYAAKFCYAAVFVMEAASKIKEEWMIYLSICLFSNQIDQSIIQLIMVLMN